jgi:hypothetical protein
VGAGRSDLARLRENWTSWRGRAVEPLIREALARMCPDSQLLAAPAVGGYWTRTCSAQTTAAACRSGTVTEDRERCGSPDRRGVQCSRGAPAA